MRRKGYELRSSSGTTDQQGIVQKEDKRFRRCICARLQSSQLAVETSLQDTTHNAYPGTMEMASYRTYFTPDVLQK